MRVMGYDTTQDNFPQLSVSFPSVIFLRYCIRLVVNWVCEV
jgi:hypothetical protein